jgi:hypothetical protein
MVNPKTEGAIQIDDVDLESVIDFNYHFVMTGIPYAFMIFHIVFLCGISKAFLKSRKFM